MKFNFQKVTVDSLLGFRENSSAISGPTIHPTSHRREDREAGMSKLYQWHFDKALYDILPLRVGHLQNLQSKRPDVKYDDKTAT